MMLNAAQADALLDRDVPGFRAYKTATADPDSGDPSFATRCRVLVDYVAALLRTGSKTEATRAFDAIEVLIRNGDPHVRDVMKTCVLESLVNLSSWGKLPAEFRDYLGPDSAAFCKAWDEFTGSEGD